MTSMMWQPPVRHRRYRAKQSDRSLYPTAAWLLCIILFASSPGNELARAETTQELAPFSVRRRVSWERTTDGAARESWPAASPAILNPAIDSRHISTTNVRHDTCLPKIRTNGGHAGHRRPLGVEKLGSSDRGSRGRVVDGADNRLLEINESHDNYDADDIADSYDESNQAERGMMFIEDHDDAVDSSRDSAWDAGSSSSTEDVVQSAESQPEDNEAGRWSEAEKEVKSVASATNSARDDVGLKDGQVGNNSVQVCVMTWNLAEASPAAGDLDFLRHAARGSDVVAVGVQEIENLKPRRHEGGRTREWRRLLIRTLGKEFVRVGHHAMGAVQLTLFARREVLDRVKVIKLTDVACGVGNVLQNKGGIGAYLRVDRTTFLFVAAHLAAHQNKVEERNAGYWRIVTALNDEVPPAWITHATRRRVKRAKAEVAAAAAAAAAAEEVAAKALTTRQALQTLEARTPASVASPRGPFHERVDRVFFFGDLNYRVDLSREDLELGILDVRRDTAGEGTPKRRAVRHRSGATYPGGGAFDPLLDMDQLTLARSRGEAFGGFAEARVTFEPTYKYDKGSDDLDTSRKMRSPAWTDRILFSPAGSLGVTSLEYASVPESRHSDHRPVFARFSVLLAD